MDIQTGRKLSPQRVIWEGHIKVIPEGPHIYKYGNWYYLLVSEGGTHDDHQISIARSKSIWGPFEGCPQNPILAPSSARANQYIQYNGHGDLFQGRHGQWFLVCLAARKGPVGWCIMGRETFLAAVQWPQDAWPVIKQPLVLGHAPSKAQFLPAPLRPELEFVGIRDLDRDCYQVLGGGRILEIRPSARDIHDRIGPISFVGKRQRTLDGQATVALRTASDPLFAANGVVAGLAYYKDEHRYARIAFDYSTSTIFVETKKANDVPVTKARTDIMTTEITQGVEIDFCIKHTEASIEFGYCAGDMSQNGWNIIAAMNTLELTDRDFTGPCIGVFSTAGNADIFDGVTVTFLDFTVNS
jgi:beta-xylosidase